MAYYTVEPFGDRIADLRAGTLAAIAANSNLGKGAKPLKPMDFFEWYAAEAAPVEPAAQPSPEAKAASLFGINLTEIKKSGKRQTVIQRRKS